MTTNGNPRWAAFRMGASIGTIFVLGLIFILVFTRVMEFALAGLESFLSWMRVL